MSIISNFVREQVELYLPMLVTGPVTLLGVVANLINFVVFLKQGVKDCVSVCLLGLTISDFGSVLTGGVVSVFNILFSLGVDSVIDSFSFTFVMSYGCAMFYDISQGIIAFITLERCLCVAMPLKFKDIFTFRRSLFVLIFLYVLTIGAYVPHFVTSGLYWYHDPATNSTRISVWVSENRVKVELYLNTFMHITMPTLYQVVILVSTQVMVIGLKRSSKFRERKDDVEKAVRSDGSVQVSRIQLSLEKSAGGETMKVRSKDHHTKDCTKVNKKTKKQVTDLHITSKQTKDSSSSLQNRRVIKTVTILAVISLVCNTVRLAMVYPQRFVPDLNFGKRYHNELSVMLKALFLFQTVNSSANILVYYRFSHSFRSMFRSVFCKKRRA